MKTNYLLITVLISSSAFANVTKVGDYSKNKGTIQHRDGTSETYEVEAQLQSYDSVTMQGTISGKSLFTSGPHQGLSTVIQQTITVAADTTNLVRDCTIVNGTVESIEVAGQIIQSCHMTDGGDQVWLANVPFGSLKSIVVDSSTGDTYSSELTDFHFAP